MKTNWPKRAGRRFLGLALAICMAAGSMVVGYADAISTYCVSVASSSVSVLKNNQVTHTFKAANSNIAIANDARSGDLLVSFNDASGGTTTMSFGQQPILLLYGNIGTMDLTSALNKPIVIGAKCTVGNLQVNAPVKVSIWGKVNGGDINAAANVIAAKGSVVSGLESRHTGANFFANAGSTVNGTKYQGTATTTENGNTFIYIGNGGTPTVNEGSSVLIAGNGYNNTVNTGTGSGGSNNNYTTNYVTHNYDGGYSITATDISANYYDRLGNLVQKLGSAVGVADKSGNRVNGTVSWYNVSSSTVVRNGGEFQFLFTPSSSSVSPMVGTIRIKTTGSGNNGYYYDDDDDYYDDDWYDRYGEYVDLEIDEIVIREDQLGRRLARFTSDLRDAVTAYNEDGREIRGTLQWLYNEKVEEPGWYEFVFIPAASKYETVRDEVKIVLEKKTEDAGTQTGGTGSGTTGGTQTDGTGTGTSTGGTQTGTGTGTGGTAGTSGTTQTNAAGGPDASQTTGGTQTVTQDPINGVPLVPGPDGTSGNGQQVSGGTGTTVSMPAISGQQIPGTQP